MQRRRGRRRRGRLGHLVSTSSFAVIVVGEDRSNGDGCNLSFRSIRLPDEAAAADADLVRGSFADDSLGRGLSRDDAGDPAPELEDASS